MKKILTLLFGVCPLLMVAGQRQTNQENQSFSARIANLRKIDGFIPLYSDEHTGKMLMEISRLNEEFLYATEIAAGVGSNDLGLDRGTPNSPVVVQFERSGPRVLLIESNYRFRATADNALEKRDVQDSFARSTLWGFEIVAEENGRLLVDATNFLLRDAAHVGERIGRMHQGQFRVDATRSDFYLPFIKAFPRNTEVETTITLTSDAPGNLVREVTPAPDAVTIREHQSFVALPEPGYKPRLQDPRAGYFSTEFMDFSAPIEQPVVTRYIARHRLEKKDPSAAISDPIEPIVYYVDPGAPADIRQALVEGASWWNQAFEAAGFRNAFQVKVLPPDADPMDVRYNVIQWVHRSTRGWSVGHSLVDPRTGEIIKGIVTLGSLREHQDYLIFEGLFAHHVLGDQKTKMLTDAVYARLRQLAAHEVGHTLGLQHNYIASTAQRASVMDYPGPWIDLRPDNTFDLSNAYAVGIGEWDKIAITWGYSQFSSGTDEKQALNKIILDAAHRGIISITDADSRPPGSAHPKSHLWDSGANAIDELARLLKIRSIALSRFGENNIQVGSPMATLEEVLVPLYFLHRYQTEAASKSIGGLDYTYAVRGDGQLVTQIVSAAEQRRALKTVLQTIDPSTLTIPENVLKLIPPRPPGYPRTPETFPAHTGLTFDPLAAAEAGADLTVSLILNSQRAARLVQYHAENAANPGLDEVIQTLVAATWRAQPRTGLQAEVAKTVNYVVLMRLIGLAVDESASPQVRSIATSAVEHLKPSVTDAFAVDLIAKFERNPKELTLPKLAEAPPGQPIGSDDDAVWPW